MPLKPFDSDPDDADNDWGNDYYQPTFHTNEGEPNYYQEDQDDTTQTCTESLFSRKLSPLMSLGGKMSNFSLRQSKSCTSLQDEDSIIGCGSPKKMSRPSSWANLDEIQYTEDELGMQEGDLPTAESDLQPNNERVRTFWVVTTAAMPWMTGTAVNPLLRAAYLSRMNRPYSPNKSTVTLVVPWLGSPAERCHLYGEKWRDLTKYDQEAYIRSWLTESAGLELEANVAQGGIQILFYPARYLSKWGSIFATGDVCSLIPDDADADVCFLEEPEHINLYPLRAPDKQRSWTDRFQHVVGIVHTNYKAYASSHFSGILSTPMIGAGCSLFVRASCHKVIKLSPILQSYAPGKEVVCNVHGVRSEFLKEGRRRAELGGKNGSYFVGKLLWAKGFDKMLELQAVYRKMTGDYFPIDVYGSGPEEEEIVRAFLGRQQPLEVKEREKANNKVDLNEVLPKSWRRMAIPAIFLGRKDHAVLTEDYKIFINPSLSEVLCTTTAEALAMGKFAIVPFHPSNTFFTQFPNCLQYQNKIEFVSVLQYALSHEPEPLDQELSHQFTWEAATDRCLLSSAISRKDARRSERVGAWKRDEQAAKLHYEMHKGVKGAIVRKVMGAGPVEANLVRRKEGLSSLGSAASSITDFFSLVDKEAATLESS